MGRKLEIGDIHLIMLDLMDRLHKVCEDHGLKYYLTYGTLIGAIRHNGFIPWDDDFDIMVPRKDYDRLIAILEKEEDPRYRIITRANTPNYYNGIARYCDMNYIFKNELDVKQYDHGIFIDIYPLDSCGATPEETENVHKRIRKLNAQYIMYCNKKSLSSKARILLRIPYYYWLHLRYGSDFGKKAEEITEEIIYSNFTDNSEYLGVYWENQDFRMFPRKCFDNRSLHDFEDRTYWIPDGYDELLTMQYGNYMILPPEDQRTATHSYSIYEK